MKALVLLLAMVGLMATRAQTLELREGEVFKAGDRSAVIKSVKMLPVVEDEYTRRFKFDHAKNPKLKELREKYRLDEIVAPGESEFDKQVLLNDWTHRQFRKFGQPSTKARGALEVLKGIEEGQTFFCAQYAELLVSAAASLGWNDRALALRRHQGANARGGSTEHTSTEIWSNEYAKWVMLDPTANMYLEKNGLPLNAWEIREEWFYQAGTNLTFVVGKERAKYKKSDLPIFLAKFENFGDLTVDPDELDKYGFIGYVPNTNFMDAGNDYGQMFIVKDALCDGTKWHVRTLPKRPDVEPYFPINQVALNVAVAGDVLQIEMKTFTPNFKTFEVKREGKWEPADKNLDWKLKPGTNRIEARSLNQFGVTGPVASLEIELQ